MQDRKPWYKSVTIWGVIASGMAHLASLFGLEFTDPQIQLIAEKGPAIAGIAADFIAAWGRTRASKGIAASRKGAAAILVIAALPIVLAVGGCAERARAILDRADKLAEPEVDAAFETIVERGCRAPIDVLNRQRARGPHVGRAMYYLCPDVRGIVNGIREDFADPEIMFPEADDGLPGPDAGSQ